jgi:hypothetical protein
MLHDEPCDSLYYLGFIMHEPHQVHLNIDYSSYIMDFEVQSLLHNNYK